MAAAADPEQARKDFLARQKMKRLGTAEEVAGAVAYLVSDEVTVTSSSIRRSVCNFFHSLLIARIRSDRPPQQSSLCFGPLQAAFISGTELVIDGGFSL